MDILLKTFGRASNKRMYFGRYDVVREEKDYIVITTYNECNQTIYVKLKRSNIRSHIGLEPLAYSVEGGNELMLCMWLTVDNRPMFFWIKAKYLVDWSCRGREIYKYPIQYTDYYKFEWKEVCPECKQEKEK